MTPESKENILGIRKKLLGKLKKKKRAFRRYSWFKHSLPNNWRKPRGIHNKTKIKEKSKPKMPNVGYITPFIIRGLHPSGYEDVRVCNLTDLTKIKPQTQAARFSSALGKRTREKLLAKAKELGVKVLNP